MAVKGAQKQSTSASVSQSAQSINEENVTTPNVVEMGASEVNAEVEDSPAPVAKRGRKPGAAGNHGPQLRWTNARWSALLDILAANNPTETSLDAITDLLKDHEAFAGKDAALLRPTIVQTKIGQLRRMLKAAGKADLIPGFGGAGRSTKPALSTILAKLEGGSGSGTAE